MCLILLNKEAEPEILSEDLKVYKILKYYSHNGALSAPIKTHFFYIPGQLYETKFTFNREFRYADVAVYTFLRENFDEETRKIFFRSYEMSDFERVDSLRKVVKSVNAGFHACATLDRAKKYFYNALSTGKQVITECIIPAGAEIFRDDTGLITGNKIIIGDILNT